jgi:sialate O-acetylesterase
MTIKKVPSIVFTIASILIPFSVKAISNINPGSKADTVKPAPFSVSKLFQSNMVIQRNKRDKIWGYATPGADVSIQTSWSKKVYTVKTGDDGKWMAEISVGRANANPQTISISTTNQPAIELKNILIGDVWVCSGQSNMVMYMEYANVYLQGVFNYQEEIAKANHPNVRYMRLQDNFQDAPVDDVTDTTAHWTVCTPAVAGKYSAIGYYFGMKLDSVMHIPVGILVSAVGATGCELWTSAESFNNHQDIKDYYKNRKLFKLYNGMIYPLRNLSIKGFLWDQGETNQWDNPVVNYTKLNTAMIEQWRSLFNQGNLPFYFVQMIPTKFPMGSDYFYALFREAQANVRKLPNTRMAVTVDDAEINNIHYRNKALAADRLARLALHYDYHLDFAADGPSYKSFKQKGATVIVSFHNSSLLKSAGPLAQVFYVAGDDHNFYQANAVISGKTIVLTLPAAVSDVKAVRYAFINTAVSNLYGAGDMPVEPFRTDDW